MNGDNIPTARFADKECLMVCIFALYTAYERLISVHTTQPVVNPFDNRLYRVNKHPTGCQTGLTTVLNQPAVKPGCTTGLTTGCIV